MRISKQGLDFIKSFEGLRLQSYWDANGGVWTIGWGHTKGVKRGQVITRADAERFIRDDLAPIERHLTADLGEDGVLQCQFDALCSFCFNLGIGAYMHSTLRKYVKAGRDADADKEFGKWVHSGGKVLPGLVTRRAAERKMFIQGGAADIAALLLGMMMAGAAVLVAMLFMM